MNKLQLFFLFALYSINCHASAGQTDTQTILDQEIYTTREEKEALFKALGIEFIDEVIVPQKIQQYLMHLAATPAAQTIFNNHPSYQHCTKERDRCNAAMEDRSILDTLIIKYMGPQVGYGVVAGKKIPTNTSLGLYAGVMRRKSDSSDADYIFNCQSIVPGCEELAIDARYEGNELRCINGSMQYPNCIGTRIFTPTGEERIIYQATEDIEEGEELLADYGKQYWKGSKFFTYTELSKKAVKVKETTKPAVKPKDESDFGKGFKKGFFNNPKKK